MMIRRVIIIADLETFYQFHGIEDLFDLDRFVLRFVSKSAMMIKCPKISDDDKMTLGLAMMIKCLKHKTCESVLSSSLIPKKILEWGRAGQQKQSASPLESHFYHHRWSWESVLSSSLILKIFFSQSRQAGCKRRHSILWSKTASLCAEGWELKVSFIIIADPDNETLILRNRAESPLHERGKCPTSTKMSVSLKDQRWW